MKRFATSLFLFLTLFFSVATGFTQTPAADAQAQPQASQTGAQPPLATENSTAKEEETGENVYRHSASVRWLGRWLHLDQEAAATLFQYLNFAILAGAVLFYLLKNLPRAFRANREKIQHQLIDARTATEQANERLAAIEARLRRLDEEIGLISKQAEKDGAEDEARIRASIETERRHIVEAVGKDIAAASSAAQRSLKQFAAGLAVDRAVQKLTLTADEDHALLQEFAQSLSQKHAGQRGKQLMSIFAARYARAFADVVLEARLNPEEVQSQLNDFAATFSGSKDLRELLLNPSIPAKKRVSILDTVNGRVGCGPQVRNFLAVLIRHERLASLNEILEAYRLEMNRRLLISNAEIVTARPLEDQERGQFEEQVAALAGSRVRATFREDRASDGRSHCAYRKHNL